MILIKILLHENIKNKADNKIHCINNPIWDKEVVDLPKFEIIIN